MRKAARDADTSLLLTDVDAIEETADVEGCYHWQDVPVQLPEQPFLRLVVDVGRFGLGIRCLGGFDLRIRCDHAWCRHDRELTQYLVAFRVQRCGGHIERAHTPLAPRVASYVILIFGFRTELLHSRLFLIFAFFGPCTAEADTSSSRVYDHLKPMGVAESCHTWPSDVRSREQSVISCCLIA